MKIIALMLSLALWAGSVAADEPRVNGPRSGKSSTVTGKIIRYTKAPHGEMDGFLLDSGTKVHFPPHNGPQLKPFLKKGQRVAVTGLVHPGPGGSIMEASTVKNLASGQSITVAANPAPDSKDSPLNDSLPFS